MTGETTLTLFRCDACDASRIVAFLRDLRTPVLFVEGGDHSLALQPSTRARRVERHVPRILAGKGLRDT